MFVTTNFKQYVIESSSLERKIYSVPCMDWGLYILKWFQFHISPYPWGMCSKTPSEFLKQ